MSLRPARFLLALLTFVPATLAQIRPKEGDLGTVLNPKELGVEITFLANEGFFLKSGRYHVLIDSFLREPFLIYAALPTELYKDLVQAKPPFDELTLVLVSHGHADHVQYRGLEKFLTNNNKAQLMTSHQVITSLKESAQDFEAIQRRVSPVRVHTGTPEILMQEEMSVSFMELKHIGKNEDGIQNLGHLITIGGMKILHVGDAAPSVENFKAYQLGRQELDIVFVPYWYYGSDSGRQVLAEQIPSRVQIACHVPPQEFDKVDAMLKEQFPGVILFRQSLEKQSFMPEGVEPASAAAPAEGGGG